MAKASLSPFVKRTRCQIYAFCQNNKNPKKKILFNFIIFIISFFAKIPKQSYFDFFCLNYVFCFFLQSNKKKKKHYIRYNYRLSPVLLEHQRHSYFCFFGLIICFPFYFFAKNTQIQKASIYHYYYLFYCSPQLKYQKNLFLSFYSLKYSLLFIFVFTLLLLKY